MTIQNDEATSRWEAEWKKLPDGIHAYERARQAGINAIADLMPAPFDVTKPIDDDSDAKLAVAVLDRYRNAAGPITPGDAGRLIQTIERMRARIADLYALGLMTEEFGETLQLIGKGLRFGMDHARADGQTARMMLPLEMGDASAAIDFACMDGIAPFNEVIAQREAKKKKLLSPDSRDDEGHRLAPEPRGRR
jgi:hypothetical protein